jgi:hypothetical protein
MAGGAEDGRSEPRMQDEADAPPLNGVENPLASRDEEHAHGWNAPVP